MGRSGGDEKSVYPELALYSSNNKCARTDAVLSQVCTGGLTLVLNTPVPYSIVCTVCLPPHCPVPLPIPVHVPAPVPVPVPPDCPIPGPAIMYCIVPGSIVCTVCLLPYRPVPGIRYCTVYTLKTHE